MREYRKKPKTRAAIAAWNAFACAIGLEPKDMCFGYVGPRDYVWAASSIDHRVWIWKSKWQRAIIAPKPGTDLALVAPPEIKK